MLLNVNCCFCQSDLIGKLWKTADQRNGKHYYAVKSETTFFLIMSIIRKKKRFRKKFLWWFIPVILSRKFNQLSFFCCFCCTAAVPLLIMFFIVRSYQIVYPLLHFFFFVFLLLFFLISSIIFPNFLWCWISEVLLTHTTIRITYPHTNTHTLRRITSTNDWYQSTKLIGWLTPIARNYCSFSSDYISLCSMCRCTTKRKKN